MGDIAAEHRRRRRRRDRPPSGRRLRRHHAVQLPVHGAAVDVPDRAHLRQHVRAEAVGKGAAVVGAAGRAARPRPACPTACSTSCTATASASTRCSTIRRWRRSRSSARRRSPSTSTRRGTANGKRVQVGRRGEEPPHHHARRRHGPDGEGAAPSALRLRRRSGAWPAAWRSPSARRAIRWSKASSTTPAACASARPTATKTSTWAR